jgi:7,8-dihydropterin-6-yl-methyl-4-(beta-D-ribofuranosyl)aminobenzene 5'-phosphate synthase
MSGTITFLVDNRAEESFMTENGFSILIENEGKRILFDTGQKGETLFHNAERLGVSLCGLDAVVLSHGHFDHSGNLAEIFRLNPSISFFSNSGCRITRWSLHPGKIPHSVGISQENNTAIMNLPPRQVHWCDTPTQILPDVWVTGSIPRKSSFEDPGGPFYQDEMGHTPDLILDDMALWIVGEKGLTLVCGCCHSGIKNTIDYIDPLAGGGGIHSLIGGFHLLKATPERLTKTISFLNETEIKRVFPAHCTGESAMRALQEQLKAQVQLGIVGTASRIQVT